MGNLGHVFPIFLILVLSCIIIVSSYDPVLFTNYDNIYQGTELSAEDSNLSEYAADIADMPDRIKGFANELILETIFVQNLLKKEDLDLETAALLFYMKFLTSYLSWYCARSVEELRNGNNDYKELADELELLAYVLSFYANKTPAHEEMLERTGKLYISKISKQVDESILKWDTNNVNSLSAGILKPIFMPWNRNVEASDRLLVTHQETAFVKGKGFIEEALSGTDCLFPNISTTCVPDRRKKEIKTNITVFGLLNAEPYTYAGKKCSRISTICQVLLQTAGWYLIVNSNGWLQSKEGWLQSKDVGSVSG